MPKLSVDTFLAALTVASLSAACTSKAAPSAAATAEPAPSAAIQPAAVAPVASAAATNPAPEGSTALGAIDAGLERRKAPAAPSPRHGNANAACGAGTCSDDMKK